MNLELKAKEIGLCAIGIAKAEGLETDYQRLLEWINKGYHGNMAWLAKSAKRRSSPDHLMPEPKSIIVCAMKYEDMPAGGEEGSEGKVKYLRHQDYHEVMMKKLEEMISELKKEHPEIKYKYYVDTGPVLEKSWGAKAGIGFIGKNTLLINPEFGSQIALGVIVCSILIGSGHLAIAPSDHRTSCGDCRACIDACPTKALVAPYILDARKCISYKFFIEKRSGGCDICQDVCPFNKEPV